MGDNKMRSVKYPPFRTFYAEVLSGKMSAAERFETSVSALLLLILRAVLLIAYHRIPKPALWDAFGLEQPKSESD